ncbi:MAG: NAD(P)H-binding protein, partial [Xenococcaceae cyanobacterium]
MVTQERLVLVAGATGGVGQLTVAKLLEKGFAVRAMTRSTSKAEKMFDGKVDLVEADTRNPDTLPKAIQDVTHIICCTGTTAFPSLRWDFNFLSPQSSPQQVDAEGVKNLVAAAPQTLQRFVFISSC